MPPAYYKAEIELIKFMIKEKDYYHYIIERLSIDDFNSKECINIYKQLNILYGSQEIIDEKVLFNKILEIPNLNKNSIDSIFSNSTKYQARDIENIIDDLIKTVTTNNLLMKRDKMLKEIEELEKKSRNAIEDEKFKQLCLDLIHLNNKINLDN